jgi:hypothetical protein
MLTYINVPFLAILNERQTDMEPKDNDKRNKEIIVQLVSAQLRQASKGHGFDDLIVGDPKTSEYVEDDEDRHQPMDHDFGTLEEIHGTLSS